MENSSWRGQGTHSATTEFRGNGDSQTNLHRFASTITSKANEATQQVGERLEKLGKSMHGQAPQSGAFRTVTEAVAGSLEHTGAYLQEASLDNVAPSITDLIRRHPLPALALGFGLGYWLACGASREKS